MALKKNSPNISDEMSLLNEVPAFLKRETSPVNPRGAKDWIMFPNDMPLVSQILGSEPIMVQSVEAEEPLTITPDDIRTWLTGTLESGSIGFITGDVLYNELSKYVPKTTKINGQALTGDITITKGDIGLGNVDNTSDMNKPISNAVNNKFQELEDTWGVDITQLKVDVNNIDQLLDKTVIEVNKLSEIIGELDTDFTSHLTDQDAHSNIRVNSMVSTDTNAKIPNVTAVRDFVTNYVSRLPEFTNPAFNNRYFYILNGANQQKISDTELKNYFKMSTIYELVVTSPSQFPDPSTLTSGTIVRVGRFSGSIIIDPYTSYSAKEGEILVFNGNTYEHLSYAENVHNFTIQGSNDKLTLNLNDQSGTIGIDLPFVTNSTPGILSPADYEALISMNGLTKYGTPNSSWEIGYTTGDLIRLDKTSGGALDLIWNNQDNPNKTDADGNVVPYYAAVTLGDLTIKGNVTQEGSSFISKAETVEVKDNTLLLNKGETGAGVTKGTAGVEIDRGTLPRYQFLFDEADDRFKVGSVGDLWPVMIRDEEADLTDGGILTWDATTKRAKTAFNIDDLADKYLPLAGGTMTGLFIIGKTSGIYFNDNKDTIAAVIGYTTSNATMYMGTQTAGGRILITGGLYRNINGAACKVWDESNDGAGSGLDADLLDGQHGSYYAKASDLSSYIPLAGNSEDTPITGLLFMNDKAGMGIYGQTVTHFDGTPRHVGMSFENNNYGGGVGEKDHSDSFADIGCSGESWYPNAISQIRVGYKDNAPLLIYRTNPGDDGELYEYNIYHEGNLDVNSMVSGFLPLSAGPTKPLTDSLYIGDDIGGDFKVKEKGLCIRSKNYLDKVQVKLISETENKNWSISYAKTHNDGSLMFEFNGIPIMSIESENQKRLIVHYGNINTMCLSMNSRVYVNHSITQANDTGMLILGNSLDEVRIDTIKESDIVHTTPFGSYRVYDERNLDPYTFALKTDLSGYLPLSGNTKSTALSGQIFFSEQGSFNDLTGQNILSHYILNDVKILELGPHSIASDIRIYSTKDIKRYVSSSNWHIVWDSGNDGSGSGLDADLLDGKQGSEYALASNLSNYLPLSAGAGKPLTGVLYAQGYIGEGAEHWNVNAKFGTNSDDHSGIEILAQNGTFGMGMHLDGFARMWIGNADRGSKKYFASISKLSRVVDFYIRPTYNGEGLARLNEIPTSLPANGGNADTVGNNTFVLYPYSSNEINFGGTGTDPNIFIGYRPLQGRPIPVAYHFGSTVNGTATVYAGNFMLNGKQVATTDQIPTDVMQYHGYQANLNTTNGTGVYAWSSAVPGVPDSYPYGSLLQWGNAYDLVPGNGSHWINQLAGTTGNILYYRTRTNAADWGSWSRIAFFEEVVTLGTAQTITGAKTFTSYTIFPAGSGTSSDIRLKKNIVKIEDADSILSKLTGYRYTVKDTQKEYAGLIAQEVQKVLPEAVREDENGFLTVDTYPIIAVLVESNNIKTQRIETLENRLFELEAKVNMLLSRI